MASQQQQSVGTPSPSAKRRAPKRVIIKRRGTSYVALKVQSKLQDAAAAPEWDLRHLIGHANTLDQLTERLADPNRKKHPAAEEEQEAEPSAEDDAAVNTPQHTAAAKPSSEDDQSQWEEVEDPFPDDSSDDDNDGSSGSDADWSSTEPSTAHEHAEQLDYFGFAPLQPTKTSDTIVPHTDDAKGPTILVTSATESS